MKRRTFVGLTTSAAIGAAVEPLSRALGPITRDVLPRTGSGQTRSTPEKLCLQITKEFMEDYTEGAPWIPSLRYAESYLSKDGTLHVLGTRAADPFTGKKWQLERVSQQADSITGWAATQSLDLAADAGYFTKNLVPQLVMITGSSDTLMVQRRGSFQTAPIAADGTIGTLGPPTTKSEESWPMITGALPSGAYWLPELLWGHPTPNAPSAGPHGLGLRDLSNPSVVIPVEPAALHDPQAPGKPPFIPTQLYPLMANGPDQFGCISVSPYGNVYEMVFLKGRDAHGDPVFKYFGQWFLGFVPNGLIYVQEHSIGQIEVMSLYFNLDAKNDQGTIHSHLGSYSPSQPSTTVWRTPPPKMFKFPAGRLKAGTRVEVQGRWNFDFQTPQLFLLAHEPETEPDPRTEIWTSLRQGDGNWLDFVQHDDGCQSVKMLAGREVGLLLFRPKVGYEIARRDRKGDWDSEHVRIPADDNGEMFEAAGYRVGITAMDGGQGLPGVSLKLTTSTPAVAVVEGKHVTLRRGRSLETLTDGMGTAWITVLMQHRLDFPVLYVDTPLCEERLAINLNSEIEDYMQKVTADDLLTARDPRRCREADEEGCSADALGQGLDKKSSPLVSDRAKAEKAAQNIRKLVSNAPRTETLRQTSTDGVELRADLGVGWLPVGTQLARRWPIRDSAELHGATAEDRHFRLVYVSGVPDHMIGKPVAGYLSGWDPVDTLNDIGDLASDTWNKGKEIAGKVVDTVTEVTNVDVIEAVKDGLSVALDFVVDTITYGVRAVIKTIEQVMDVVCLVLDYAGMVLGEAVGWLLEQLGFLFDWKAIKAKRSELKDTLREITPLVAKRFRDPRVSATEFKRSLDSAKATTKSKLLTLRSNPMDKKSMGSMTSLSVPLPELFKSGSDYLFPQATWMLEKVQSALSSLGGDLSAPYIEGLLDRVVDLGVELAAAAASLGPTLADFQNLIQQWFVDGKLLSSAAIDPLVDIILRRVDAIFEGLKTVVTAGGELLRLLWDNAGKVLEWLDQTIRIPFFSSFYKALTGHDLSILDVACLLAAIPIVIGKSLGLSTDGEAVRERDSIYTREDGFEESGDRRAQVANVSLRIGGQKLFADVDPNQAKRAHEAAVAFHVASCLTSPLSAFATAIAPPNAQDTASIFNREIAKGKTANVISKVLTVLDQCMNAAAVIASTFETDNEALQIAIPSVLGVIGGLVGLGMYKFPLPFQKYMWLGFAMLGVVNGAMSLALMSKPNESLVFFLTVFQNTISAVVAEFKFRSKKALNGPAAVAVTIATAVIQVTKTVIWTEQPIST
jgi:hypothetical protein